MSAASSAARHALPGPLALDDGSMPFPVWLVRSGAPLSPQDLALLSEEERGRAARLREPAQRHRNLQVRLTLRTLVEQVCGIPAGRQCYTRNRWGKPMLVEEPSLRFSLSYSGDCGLIGISTEFEIGVDLERQREVADATELATLCFASEERAEASRCFVLAWTRKEACLKALGRGLQIRPDRVCCGCSDRLRTVRLNHAVVHVGSAGLATGHHIAWAWREPAAPGRMSRSRPRITRG